MYFIVQKDLFMQHDPVANSNGAHWIDLPDGNILVKTMWKSPFHENRFRKHPQVVSLPSPSTSKKVGDAVAKHLAHLGVTADHTTADVVELATAQFADMRHR